MPDRITISQIKGEVISATPVVGSYKIVRLAYTANTGDRLAANTKGGQFAITLPSSPSNKNIVEIIDAENNFANTTLIVSRNGSTIEGQSANLILDVTGSSTTLQYDYSKSTWQVFTPGIVSGITLGGVLSGLTSAAAFSNTLQYDYSKSTWQVFTPGVSTPSTSLGGVLSGLASSAAFSNPLPITSANTNITGGMLLITSNTNYSKTSTTLTNRGRTVLSGANTDIKGTNLYVSSNVHVSSSVTFANTLVVLKGSPIRVAGGNNVTLALGDNGKFLVCTNSTSAMNIHIATNASVAFPIGGEISFFNQCTASGKKRLGFSKASGVTLLSKNSANSVANTNSSASVKKILSDTWVLVGDLT